MAQTVILRGDAQRALACRLIASAPPDAVVTIKAATRNLDQNARLWASLSDISRAKPEGRAHTPEVWKTLFMAALGHEVRFEMGLDNRPFPIGFSSSKLSKAEFADLITFVQEYGDRHGVAWSEPPQKGYENDI
jgi:hypothetical protein